MFKSLVESIRLEAAARGSLQGAYSRTPGMNKEVKKGTTRFLRQQGKKEINTQLPDDVNIPRRGIKGYAD